MKKGEAMKKKKSLLSNPVAPFLFLSLFVLLAMGVERAAGSNPADETTTPIKHVVVIFQENVSFDHYFGTYPAVIKDASGHVIFRPKDDTPRVNGLTHNLLTNNQNSAQPFLLTENGTCDQDHNYTPEQQAYDQGAADEFVEFTEGSGCAVPYEVMGYYDGSLVTAMWNYAQNFAMSDNYYNTCYGPSTPGALNLICGNTAFASGVGLGSSNVNGTQINDGDPTGDIASSTTKNLAVTSGLNVGDLLNKKGLTWGWFEGGFADPTAAHVCVAGVTETDYIPHHEPFQYFASTANPKHLPPTSVAMIGHTDQANHQYDLTDFWSALAAHNLPAVSYLKAPAYQDGHAGYSGPTCEQEFLAETINQLQKSPEWSNMAIIVTYDDSDGWYDHQAPPVVNYSHIPGVDPFTYESNTPPSLDGIQGRMGYGPRLPLLVISPFSKDNYVDHKTTDQTSVLRFIEDNWDLGRLGNGSFDAIAGSIDGMFDFDDAPRHDRLFLNPDTGTPQLGI
jgi:phospholipase C